MAGIILVTQRCGAEVAQDDDQLLSLLLANHKIGTGIQQRRRDTACETDQRRAMRTTNTEGYACVELRTPRTKEVAILEKERKGDEGTRL